MSETGPKLGRRGSEHPRLSLLGLAVGVLAWEVAGQWASFRFLPPFSQIVGAGAELIAGGQILGPLMTSLLSLLVGYAAAVVLGLSVGVMMGRYPIVEFVLSPYVTTFLATPKIALVPILFALFGVSRLIQVVVIFLSAFFVIVLNTMRGIQLVDPALVEMGRSFGASEGQLLRRVLLPGALPLAMAGLRLAIGHAVRSMITAEMLIALFGLGALLRSYGSRFEADKVFAILLIVICVALACTSVLRVVQRRLTGWTELET